MERVKAYATFIQHSREEDPYNRIRFSKAASKAFLGYTHCDISKTGDDKYIVFTLHTEWEKNPALAKLHFDESQSVVIACKRLVTMGFLKPEWFGKSYKVKKTKDGKIVICLSEEVA